jgi:hypothetical protein
VEDPATDRTTVDDPAALAAWTLVLVRYCVVDGSARVAGRRGQVRSASPGSVDAIAR